MTTINDNKQGHTTAAMPLPNEEQLRRFAAVLISKGTGCVELRVIGNKIGKTYHERQNHCGFYTDIDALVRDALRYHAKKAVYIGLNRRKPELLHALPGANQLHDGVEGASNDDVLARDRFPIDIDAKRPSKKVAASETELKAALAVRDAILLNLHEHGVAPIPGMSGNGGHALIATVPYPPDKGRDSKDGEFALLLRYFNRKFGNDAAEVDESVYDPVRIWKYYGTAAIKGGNTVERPWRTATISLPDNIPEPVDLLAIYASEIYEQREFEVKFRSAKSESQKVDTPTDWRNRFSGNFNSLNIVDLAKDRNFYSRPIGDGKHAIRCFNEDAHTSGTVGDGSTVIFEAKNGKWPGFKCSHSHCVHLGFREFLENIGPETVDIHCSEHIRRKPKLDQKKCFDFIKMEDLLKRPEEKVDWLVDGMLTMGGTGIVAAKPKVGKTTLLRQLALAVSRGETFLGRNTAKGPVLSLCVEEKLSEVQRHFKELGAKGNEEIYVHASSAPKEAIELLKVEIQRVRPVLVIIDTLFKVIRVEDSNDYAFVTSALEPLQSMARESGAHVLCVHHMGKMDRENGDGVLGSTAITGAVDTVVILNRKEKYRTMRTIQRYGKDMEETILEFNETLRTTFLGNKKRDADTDEVGDEILDYLCQQKDLVTEKDISESIGGNRGRRRFALRKLCDSGRVIKTGKGGKSDPSKYGINPQWRGISEPGSPV